MRKSKFRLHLIIAVSCITPLLCACFAKKTSVNIPEEYFLSGEINTGNQSAIHFNDNGTYGFGFFFLGTPIRQSDIVSGDNDNPIATLEHNGVKITCRSQLRGYYSTNFTNFGMFPIDEYTANKINNGVQFITGGLFTNCDDEDGNWTDENDDGVYGYVKRQYGNNGENIHEIWAGITKTGWKFESELKLVESDDKKNIALSGIVYDSLAKRSQVVTNFFEKVSIKIPDEYFTMTKVFSGNVNEVFYSSEGYYGFGLFFLGTGIDGNFNVTDTSGVTLTCSKQVNGYHLINFNEFGMFPLDRNTENYSATKNNVRIQNGGLYYNCKRGNKVYTGVYGYLKWNYNLDNTHELRAGVDTYGHRKDESPLDIIYSENPWNTGVSLSGTFHTSLAKNGQAINRLFGDIGLIMSGENLITYSGKTLLIDYMAYKTNDIKMYVKSSVPGSDIEIFILGNTLWPNAYDRKYGYATSFQTGTNENSLNMENTRSAGGFYGLYERDLVRLTGFSNGYLYARVRQGDKTGKLQNIYFKLINETPEITIQKLPVNACSNMIIIGATADKLADKIKYIMTGESKCGIYGTEFTNDYTGKITLTDDELNGKYICFRAENDIDLSYKSIMITGIDSKPPVVNESPNFSGIECSIATGYIIAYDSGGCSNNVQAKFEGDYDYRTGIFENGSLLEQKFYYYATKDSVGTQNFNYTVKDSANNTITGSITMQREDAKVTGENFSLCTTITQGIIEGEGDRKDLSNSHAGDCEQVYATVKECKYGKAKIEGDTIKYAYDSPSLPQGWYDKCTITVEDGDDKIDLTMTIKICRVSPVINPIIVGGKNFVDRCYTGGYTQSEIGTFLYDSACNNMPETQPKQGKVTKYTSGSHIIIDINKQQVLLGDSFIETAPIKRYRVSCIEGDSYCTKYETGWNDIGCEGIYSGYYENIWGCTWSNNSNASCDYNKEGQKCKHCALSIFGICILEDDGEVSCNNNSACRRGCNDTPSSGYFQDILGCTYTDNTLAGQCISEDTLSLFGIINLGGNTNENGKCWRGCSSNVVGRNDINNYINECRESRSSLTDNEGGYKCIKMESPRSQWQNYNGNIEVDLESMKGCSNYGKLTPNGSKYQGQRTIWVQVEDNNKYKSKKAETDIVVYDLGNYSNVDGNWYSGWTQGSPSLSFNNENITNTDREIHLQFTVEDAQLLYGLLGYTGQQSDKENILMDFYQKYISFSSYHIIAKNLELARIMKGICQTGSYKTMTGTFTSHINDSCLCSGPTCSGDYHRFNGLTGHIPAIDYGCEALSTYTITDVTTGRYNSNPNMVCDGELTGISCTPSTQRRTHEFSGEDAGNICNKTCERSNPTFGCFANTGDNPIETTTCNVRYPKKTVTITETGIETQTTYEIYPTPKFSNNNNGKTACKNSCKSDPLGCYDANHNNISNNTNPCLRKNTYGGNDNGYYYYQKITRDIEVTHTHTEQVDDLDHPIYYYYDHVITKTNCQDVGYDSCKVYSCSKYDNKNTFECSYKTCTNFGSGNCMEYETEAYTGDTYVDSSCTCILTKDYPETYIPGVIDENKYRCKEITGDAINEIIYQCYECIEYQCTKYKRDEEGKRICKGQAYSTGVTYFSVDKPRDYRYGSHLKLRSSQIIINQYISSFTGPVQLRLKKDDGQDIKITGYNLRINSNGAKNWQDKVDVTVSITDINTKKYCGNGGKYRLTLNEGFISDFALNTTKQLNIIGPETIPLSPCECDPEAEPVCNGGENHYNYDSSNLNSPDPNIDLDKYCNNKGNDCDPKCICRGENAKTQQCICNENSNSYNPNECKVCNDNIFNQQACNLFKAGQQKPSCEDDQAERDAYCSYPNHKDELECACRGEAANSKECKCTSTLCSYERTNSICLNGNENSKPHLCIDYYDYNNNTLGYCNCNRNSPNEYNKALANPTKAQTYCELYSNQNCNKTTYNCENLEEDYVKKGSYYNYNGNDIKIREARCSCFTNAEEDLRDYVDCQTSFNNNQNDPKVQCACSCENGLGTIINNRIPINTGDNIYYTGEEEDGFEINEARNSLLVNEINYIEFNKGIQISIPTEKPVCDGKIICEADPDDCPGFSCIVTNEFCGWTRGNYKGIDDISRELNCESTLKISVMGEFKKDGTPIRTGWSNCKVKLDAGNGNLWNKERRNNNGEKVLELEFYLFTGEKTAFKAGDKGAEDFSKTTVYNAIENLGGDEGFFFYNTQKQWINYGGTNIWNQKSGVLGSVKFNINFDTGVADIKYHIGGKAVINGYEREINIDVPTNENYYENPASYLSTFPEY